MTIRVGIIGGGAWGTALAIAAHAAERQVTIWDREKAVVDSINMNHTNACLPDIQLPADIKATHNIAEALDAEIVLMVTAAQAIPEVCTLMKPHLREDTSLVLCSKGIHQSTGKLFSEDIQSSFPDNPFAVLSGPAFAVEVAANLPTAVTIAAENIQASRWLASSLNSEQLRLYPSEDLVGVQLGGSLKNVVAIASGISEGLNLGKNAQASLITRGLAEITKLGDAMGAKAHTFTGMSGFGDTLLSCTSSKSRNMSLGLQLAQGKSLDQITKETGKLTEGAFTAKAVHVLCERYNVEMPICTAIYDILYNNLSVKDAIHNLLTRAIRDE